MTAFKRKNTRLLFANPYWEYHVDRYVLPDLTEADYHYVHSRGSVLVVPKLPDERFVLVRQFRYLNQRLSLEFPGGGIEPGQQPKDAATRELREETGHRAESLTVLGQFNPCKGICDEICTVFLANATPEGDPTPDPSEDLHPVHMTAHQIRAAIIAGDLWDGMSLAAWTLYCTMEG